MIGYLSIKWTQKERGPSPRRNVLGVGVPRSNGLAVAVKVQVLSRLSERSTTEVQKVSRQLVYVSSKDVQLNSLISGNSSVVVVGSGSLAKLMRWDELDVGTCST